MRLDRQRHDALRTALNLAPQRPTGIGEVSHGTGPWASVVLLRLV